MDTLPRGISRIIVPADAIQERVAGLAQQIDGDFHAVRNVLILGILRGAFIFMADLTRQLATPHVVDFMALMSYRKNESLGEVHILMDARERIRGQHVLIVEDILDSGDTLNYLYRAIGEREPASLRTCVLVRKERGNVNLRVPIDYVGFDIPDVWVVGYGLDYDNRYRTLPYIAEIDPAVLPDE
jgi:hypoxanthine phosphoribosyltransferase